MLAVGFCTNGLPEPNKVPPEEALYHFTVPEAHVADKETLPFGHTKFLFAKTPVGLVGAVSKVAVTATLSVKHTLKKLLVHSA